MRKILTILLLFLCSLGFGQSLQPRAPGTVTVLDSSLFAGKAFRVPAMLDTTTANTYRTLDSAGKLLFTYDVNGLWVRQSNPLKWSQIGSTSNPIRDTVYTKAPIAVFTDSTGHQVIYFLQNGLIAGGIVTRAACLQIGVTPAIFGVNYKTFTNNAAILTVQPADSSFPRTDIVVADTSGRDSIITGTPSSTPVAPTYNHASEVLLGSYTIQANASCIGINVEIVHDENGYPEWAVTKSGTITFDSSNTNNPYHLTKAIFVSTYANGSQLIFTKQNGNDTSQLGEILNFFVYLNAALGNNQLQISFFNGSTLVGNSVAFNNNYGMNPNDSVNYQNISIPFSAFNINPGTVFTKIVIQFAGNDLSGARGLYIDYIQLQTGGSQVGTGRGVLFYGLNITNDSTLVLTDDGRRFAIKYNSGGGSDSVTANNGLTKTVHNIQLGGIIIQNTTITKSGDFTLQITNNSASVPTIQIINSAAGGGINASSTSTVGNVAAITGANSSTGAGINGTSQSGYGATSLTNTNDSNNVYSTLKLQRTTGGAPNRIKTGYGTGIDFNLEANHSPFNNNSISNRILSYWSNAYDSVRVSVLSFIGYNNATQDTLITATGNGAIRFNQYGSNTFTGTPVHSILEDASGNLIEGALSSGGTLTNLTATNNYAQTWTITNPTTTPNLSLVLDTTKYATRLWVTSQIPGTPNLLQVTTVGNTTNSINFLPQATATANPATGNVLFDSSGINYRGSTGLTINLTKSILTANRRDSFPDESGIFLMRQDSTIYQPKLTAGNNITIANDIISASGAVSNTITEQKTYYRGEYLAQDSINRANGAIVACDTSIAISGYLHVFGSESVTISVPVNYPNITIYGWTYDTTLTAISEIRSKTLIGTTLNAYTFTTPSNARYMTVYIKFAGLDFAKALQIRSTNTITYNTPITPEQYSGTKSKPIQSALDFARFTSTGVTLTGSYTIDSSLIMSSGSTLILNNATLTLDSASKTNIIRNEAVKSGKDTIFARGNTQIKIIGIGNAVIQGSKASFGGYPPSGVGTQYWRAIGIEFANVYNFEISGITIRNTNMWAINLEQCRIGIVSNVTLYQDSSHLNQDGINVRMSDRITLDNIKGVTHDDMIALTNTFSGGDSLQILGTSKIYEPYKTNLDIHSIIIKNVQRDTSTLFVNAKVTPFYQSGILILGADSLKVHDITIDGVSGIQQIQLGYPGYNYYVTPTLNNLYNINISNTNTAKINFYYPLKNSSFINIADSVGGVINAQFAAGSQNVYRRFYTQNPEWYDTAGVSTVALRSGTGNTTFLHQYLSTSTTDGFTNAGALTATKSLILVADGDVENSGTDTFSLRVGGRALASEAMRVNPNGRVGFFNNSPTFKFDISESVASTDGLRLLNSSSTGAAFVRSESDNSNYTQLVSYGSGNALAQGLPSNGVLTTKNSLILIPDGSSTSGGTNSIQFRTGGYNSAQERMRIFSNGKIGINETSDSTTYQVNDNGTLFSTGITAASLTGNTTSGGTLTLNSTSNGTKGKILFGANSAYDEVNTRLGIGKTSPADAVDISGSAAAGEMGITTTNTSSTGYASWIGNNDLGYYGFLREYGSAYTLTYLRNTAAFGSQTNIAIFTDGSVTNGGLHNIQFFTGGYNQAQIRAMIFSNGNTSFGTTTDSTSGKVIVVGKISNSSMLASTGTPTVVMHQSDSTLSQTSISSLGGLLKSPKIVANADLTSQSAAGNIVTYTTGASDSSFMITANLNITAISVDVIQTQVVYTDETNTSRTLIFYGMGLTSAGLAATGVSNYAPMAEVRVKASTTITVQTTLTTGAGSITFNAHSTIIGIR